MKFWETCGFGQPWWLLLLLLLPVLAWMLGWVHRPKALLYSSGSLLAAVATKPRGGPKTFLLVARIGALALIILALAEPRRERGADEQRKYGIDIVLCCDISGSMASEDFFLDGKKVRRIDALIDAIGKFVKSRPADRNGVVGFNDRATILSPLTLDASWVAEVLGEVPPAGTTAIGEGIFAAIDLLKESKEKARVIILVTDGESNGGRPPTAAAEAARKLGIRIYALEIQGFSGFANKKVASRLDPIVQATGGQCFTASDTAALVGIYNFIDQLEKQRIEQKQFKLYEQLFDRFLLAALLLALAELGLGCTVWLRIP